jgi:Domain of unknown function (DUF4345)
LFDLEARFLVPTRASLTSARAGAVKVRRRTNLAACATLAKPHLDDFEHDGTLDAVGMTAAFWLYAAFNDKYRDAALLTAILFAGGLVVGRCVSLIVDGQPAPVLLIYGAMEFAVVLIGYWIYTRPE